jgi:hypothetical protein
MRWPLLAIALLLTSCSDAVRNRLGFLWSDFRGGYSVAERVDQFGLAVAARVQPDFAAAGLSYPPGQIAYVAFKDAAILEVYARDHETQPWSFIRRYPVRAASGRLGPKLQEGDEQVPEGIYEVESLNPNSRYHLSLRVSYPNDFDRGMAQSEGRSRLGGDIMIHGDARSIGCLAMGNEAAEDLFVLAALAAQQPTKVIISPTDFRASEAAFALPDPPWVSALYGGLQEALGEFPKPSMR